MNGRMEDRRRRAAAYAAHEGLEGLLVGLGPDMGYLTGYQALPLERLTLLILPASGEPVLVVPRLEAPGAVEAGVDVEMIGWTDDEDPYALVARHLSDGTWAITDQTWSAHLLRLSARTHASFEPSSEAMPLLRAVKDADELDALRAAGRGADAAFAEVRTVRFEGRSEREIAAEIDRALLANGHERVDFHIVGSGPNAASPHHEPGERIIRGGDAVVLDFGGVARGYCSDITRTVFVGEPTDEQRHVYEIVRRAQQAAFDAVRPGVAAQDVDRAARSVIAEAGFADRFIHRTGHGIGREVHEPPYIVEGNEILLEPGMTFSDEPGIYLDGRFGVRIEDQVAVTATGAERLNEATREIVVVA